MAEYVINCQPTGDLKHNHLWGGRRWCEKETNILLGAKRFDDAEGERTDWFQRTEKSKVSDNQFVPADDDWSV